MSQLSPTLHADLSEVLDEVSALRSAAYAQLGPISVLELAFCADAKISKLLPLDHMFLERIAARDFLSQELRI